MSSKPFARSQPSRADASASFRLEWDRKIVAIAARPPGKSPTTVGEGSNSGPAGSSQETLLDRRRVRRSAFARASRSIRMAEIKPFTVNPSAEAVEAVLERVRAYPWPITPEVEDGWNYGCDGAFLKELCAYWTDGYDWRAAVAELNKFPQFTAQVEDYTLHFVHVVGEAEDAFDVIVPSLPGFGFSSKPKRPIGQRTTARLFNGLMTEVLGYDRYLAQGGDWGAIVTSWLGLDHGAHAKAIHLNMIGFRPTGGPQNEAEIAWITRTQAA